MFESTPQQQNGAATQQSALRQKLENGSGHPKLTAAMFAGMVTPLVLGIGKTKFGIDLDGYEQQITALAMVIFGYFIGNGEDV